MRDTIVLLEGELKSYKRDVKAIVKTINFPLDKVYDSYHLIPKNEEGKKVLKIIEKKNWKQRFLRMLYKDNVEENGINDGYTKEGYRSWELLSCDYKKLKTIIKTVFSGETIDIICFSWQVEIVKELTKNINIRIRIAEIEE